MVQAHVLMLLQQQHQQECVIVQDSLLRTNKLCALLSVVAGCKQLWGGHRGLAVWLQALNNCATATGAATSYPREQ